MYSGLSIGPAKIGVRVVHISDNTLNFQPKNCNTLEMIEGQKGFMGVGTYFKRDIQKMTCAHLRLYILILCIQVHV